MQKRCLSLLLLPLSTLLACDPTVYAYREGQQNEPVLLVDSASEPYKIAVLGDTGVGDLFTKALELIRDEKTDMVLQLGDLGYDESNPKTPELWDRKITAVLGANYPYLFLIGNHDRGHWSQTSHISYEKLLEHRLSKNPQITCVGEHGVKSYCQYKDFFFVMSGIGTSGFWHENFIAHALYQGREFPWKLCGWHKNQTDMQVGTKKDEVGWKAYQHCQSYGAMIGTAHEHSYARTRNLMDVGNRGANHGAFGDFQNLELSPGKTFVFVSGLGGQSIRPYHCKHEPSPWWASFYTSNYFYKYGRTERDSCDVPAAQTASGPLEKDAAVLFITFHHGKDPHLAKAEFKTIRGEVLDEFYLKSAF